MTTESTRQSVRSAWRDRQVWVVLLCVAGQLLTTHALLKLALLSLAAIVLISYVQGRGFRLTRPDMMLCGAVLFGMCYAVCPYWTISTLPEGTGGVLTLVGLAVLGWVWCWCFGQPVVLPARAVSSIPWLMVAVVLIVTLFGRGLFAPLEWRGDEDTHLLRLWTLKDIWLTTPIIWLLPLCFALWLLGLWNPGRRLNKPVRWALVIGPITVLAWAMEQHNDAGQLDYWLRRYPAALLWLQGLLTWSGRGWERALTSGPELARLLPAMSVVVLVMWWALRMEDLDLRATSSGGLLRVLVPLALGSIPILQCYATSIYLELPLIVLMIWVCCRSDRLLEAALKNDTFGPEWLALALIPFLKETSIVFCLAVIASAAWFGISELVKGGISPRALLGRICRLSVVVLLPAAVYFYFRTQGPSVRFPYSFYLPNFTEPALYRIFFTSLWQQCGVLLVFSVVGLVCAWRSRPRIVVFCVIVLVGYFLFFCGSASRRVPVGDVTLPGYLGYARFNLYLIAPLSALAWQGVVWLNGKRRGLLLAATAIWVALNLWMSPLHADGTRIAGWADQLIDTEGHHYPYPELYRWFGETVGEQRASVAVVGRRYSYDVGDQMYARRFGLDLDITTQPFEASAKLRVGESLMSAEQLRREFEQATAGLPEYIVIHEPAWGPQWPDPPTLGQYGLAAEFVRGGHRLIVYRRRR